jgi:hypothetical protein
MTPCGQELIVWSRGFCVTFRMSLHGGQRTFVVWDKYATEGLPWPCMQHIATRRTDGIDIVELKKVS